MKYQIDQSIKIEQTQKDTILGIANGITYTILIRCQTKRKLQDKFRKMGNPRLFVYRSFIAGIVLLIKYAEVKEKDLVTIDREYFGLEKLLKDIYHEMSKKHLKNTIEISFSLIGKKSRAHQISFLTMKRKIRPSREITYKELAKIALK